ncbi:MULTISPECIES: phosphoribosylamine--glycine ligase [unclassified Paenibacillus]|uniref:phosphoribosylamine--glycine ligase n=1 Tax=unclassified Paenibacillus TaxID=185978 RepID=UPI001048014F|nr:MULTISPECIES: phosphoribosylamine--glycine ligase [unclassified Paenibacillus]NIK69643.1 phosphoribosylamine--glycine ligase [Paenibacillus sp. BK720]TCM95819.1 phosphoribosylamine--glycine ligase [Paenibacillus sp. BK033]
MRILVVGGGGREHAIVWALKKSEKVKEVFCAPGNAGIAQIADCVAIAVDQFDELVKFAKDAAIDLVFIGPDDPLAAGIVDAFEAHNIPVYGPNKAAAEIEGSKIFMKDLLRKYNIPTAKYETFTDYESALTYLREQSVPIVIKADGLAAGKGVTVAYSMEEAEKALKEAMVDKVFGEAGNQIVIEEFLEGQEMSILAFVDGETVKAMVPAQDHKPVFDNDKGPNTGGMGTYTPLPHIDQAIIEESIENIIKPTAKAMVSEGRPFRGVLFAGLMITKDGPKTIEFNARMGDPETQVVLPRLKTELVDVVLASLNGRLDQLELEWSDEAAVCVIVASEGYPASYPKGREITGLDAAEAQGALVFHAGTAEKDGKIVTSGGRVLGVVGRGRDIAEARARAYEAVSVIHFDGMHSRTDIAAKALKG